MPDQASPLLSTKLNRPPVPRDWVDRPRLIEQLNRSLQQGPLTLVCASAGFGKTTLVSSWIEGLTAGRGGVTPPPPAAWLSLDESDSDLVVFLRYFVAAIRRSSPNRAPRPSRCSARQTRQLRRRSWSRSAMSLSDCLHAWSWCWMTTMPFVTKPYTIF